jgi:hypothetical protein
VESLAATIQELGTDKYDPKRKGVHEDFYQPFTIDLFAEPCVVSERLRFLRQKKQAANEAGDSVMAGITRIFYKGALADRGYSIRLDVLTIYDLDQLEPVPMQWTPDGPIPSDPPPREESCDFTFATPDRKQQALLGIIKVLR